MTCHGELKNCSLFRPWTDPLTGVVSYVLTQRVAPVQQSFYFTNRSLSTDGRYLWFYCAYPPSGDAYLGRTLAVLDLQREKIQHFPETLFRDGSPFIEEDSGSVYWCSNYAVYRRGPTKERGVERVNAVPESIHKNRYGKRLATHLTLSADRRELLIDAHFGREWCVGSLPLDGSDFVLWKTFDRCYNHAQFSPTHPDLALIAQDWWHDVATGEYHGYENRIWLLRRNGDIQPVLSTSPSIAHEWWDPDGLHIWYVDYSKGTEKVNITTKERRPIWPDGTCHSHSSRRGDYLVGDIGTYSWHKTGCRVSFFNVNTGKQVNIASNLPVPEFPRGSYHIDPHPQFCLNDSVIIYTTTVLGRIDVALVETKNLVDVTS